MISPMVSFLVTLSDLKPRFQGHGVIFRPIGALIALSVRLTRDLFAIAKFLFLYETVWQYFDGYPLTGASNTGCLKNSDFRPIASFISEMMLDTPIVIMEY